MDPSEPTESCEFPAWVTLSEDGPEDAEPLLSFSFTSQYSFPPDPESGGQLLQMSVSNYSSISEEAHLISSTECIQIVDERNGEYVKMRTKVTAGW